MRRYLTLCILALLCFTGCTEQTDAQPLDAVGKWVCEESSAFFFELYEGGSCIMFDEDGEWVSQGTYISAADHIAFTMDTGSFTWVKEDDAMVFESGGTVYHYRLQK